MDKQKILELVNDRDIRITALIVVFILIVVFSAVQVMAGEQNHECQGGHNCNGGENGEANANSQSTSNSSSRSGSAAKSGSHSGSSSTSSSGDSFAEGGQSDSRSSANGGNSSSTGGDSVSNIQIDGDESAASSAAAVYAAYCINSASGQGFSGGGAITSQDVLCEHMKVADRMLIAYQQMVEWCKSGTNPACDRELEIEYYNGYTENLADVERIMRQSSITGQVSKTSGQLVIPFAMLWLLFLL
jgi:hypothetical protein